MEGRTTFTSDKEPLQDILRAVAEGRTQLPEFQRGWVWDDAHIRSLIASVSLSYPIGAIMILENGNPDVRFKPRPVEGVELGGSVEPERFILDGQQRLTSLYQAIMLGRAVKTLDSRKKKINRWYYIDMRKALELNGDREDAIRSLPEDKIVKNFRGEVLEDFTTQELEYKNCLFPAWKVFDPSEWRREFNKYWKHDEKMGTLYDEFEKLVIESFKQYHVPVIKLLKNTPKIAVCQVFEKVNTGGVSLTVFELVTASFAADGYNLREDWEGKRDDRGRKTHGGRHDRLSKKTVLKAVGPNEVLQSITLLTTFDKWRTDKEAGKEPSDRTAVSCKRVDILKLSLEVYLKWVEQATEGFESAAKILFEQKLFSDRDLPYGTQLVPLATLLTLLGDQADKDAVRQNIVRWFWCGVFGELYGGATDTRLANDVRQVMTWLVDGTGEPSTIVDSNFPASRLLTLRTRNSAAYKGINALLMREGCLDFRKGQSIEAQTYFDEKIDIHHIFPRAWCRKHDLEAQRYDSIINKSPLAAKTNRIIGGKAPSKYLEKLRAEGITEDRQTEILESHIIDPDALLSDNFDSFFDHRKEQLLQLIEKVTAKKVDRQLEEDDGFVDENGDNDSGDDTGS